MATQPTAGPRIGHMVLNVRDIEASHRFYTEALGFEQCGEMAPGSRVGIMRFYRGDGLPPSSGVGADQGGGR